MPGDQFNDLLNESEELTQKAREIDLNEYDKIAERLNKGLGELKSLVESTDQLPKALVVEDKRIAYESVAYALKGFKDKLTVFEDRQGAESLDFEDSAELQKQKITQAMERLVGAITTFNNTLKPLASGDEFIFTADDVEQAGRISDLSKKENDPNNTGPLKEMERKEEVPEVSKFSPKEQEETKYTVNTKIWKIVDGMANTAISTVPDENLRNIYRDIYNSDHETWNNNAYRVLLKFWKQRPSQGDTVKLPSIDAFRRDLFFNEYAKTANLSNEAMLAKFIPLAKLPDGSLYGGKLEETASGLKVPDQIWQAAKEKELNEWHKKFDDAANMQLATPGQDDITTELFPNNL